jgi:amino acid transporter
VTQTREPATQIHRELGLRDLTLFAIAVIVGPRWITIAAHAGPGSVTLWVAAAVLFAAPLGVVVAALMKKYPGSGGLYLWTREDFGPWHGFLAFWTYWFAIALTLPGSALFAMSVSAFTFGPRFAYLADNRAYVLISSLTAIWIALGTNIVGMKVGKWTENAGGFTSWAIAALLAGAAALVWRNHGSVTPMNVWPVWNWDTLSLFGGIAYALSGMELLGMMSSEIRSPERTVVPATWVASLFATAFYIVTTIALLVLVRPEKVEVMHGLADGADIAAKSLGWVWIAPAMAALVVVNGIGGWGGYGASVSRLPHAAGVDALLPAAFGRIHPRWGTPVFSILILGGVTSFLLVVTQLGDTLRAAYQTIVSLMVIAGFLPYIYIFISGWMAGRRMSAVSGMAITALAIISSVVPTPDVTNVVLFEAKIIGGTVLMIGLAWMVYRRGSRNVTASEQDCQPQAR